MGRPRKTNQSLPTRVYFKHGAYYFDDPLSKKWLPLGKELDAALTAYAPLAIAAKVHFIPPSMAARLFRRAKNSAKSRRIQFLITESYVEHLLRLAGKRCSVSGALLSVTHDGRFHCNPWTPTIDRIDSKLPYQERQLPDRLPRRQCRLERMGNRRSEGAGCRNSGCPEFGAEITSCLVSAKSLLQLVGTPRFELGTPCTPCEQSLRDKTLIELGNSPSFPSRIDVGSAKLSPCSAKNLPSNSGRIREAQQARYYAAKRKAGIPTQLDQPALLTDRLQPIRRPILRLRKSS